MSDSSLLVPEPSKGTKNVRGFEVSVRMSSAQLIMGQVLLFLLIPLLIITAVSAAEIDSDLVFDDGTASNDYGSHADHRKSSSSSARHHSNTSRRFENTKFHQGASSSDHQIVAPVESPLEDPEEVKPDMSDDSDSSFFGTLSDLGKRAKRDWSFSWFGEEKEHDSKHTSSATEGKGLFGFSSGNLLGDWFGGSDGSDKKSDSRSAKVTSATKSPSETEQSTASHRNRRSATSDNLTDEGADESTTEQLEVEENDESDLTVAAARRRGQLQHHVSDDEDYFSEAASGSGMDGRTVPPPSAVPPADRQPRFYRITFTILEPFRAEYYDRNSEAFRQLSQDLSQAVNELYENVSGRQSATVIQIQQTDENFSSLVTLDLGTIDNYNENQLRERLYTQIADYRRLGGISASEKNFNFRSFGGPPPPPCQPNETVCRSGECLPQETRCDGKRDCRDGSDEFGCIPTSTSPASTAFPGGLPPTIDRCRADDKVRCADGTVSICNVQLCDGVPDCPSGDDEANCPPESECGEGEFICDMIRCILGSKRCDGHPDCSDGTDEQDCPPPPVVCQPDEWQCDYGSCIDRRLRCNGRQDCPRDNSDERNCLSIAGKCSQWQFTCGDGACIDGRLRCDTYVNCPNDDSDEKFCPCKEDEFTCANKYCIPKSNRCDGFNNCQDGSDEQSCQECEHNEFQCRDKTCISVARRCDRHYDCPDGSDEVNCREVTACREDQFRCNDGVCLNINQRCNFIQECVTGEDEKGCTRCTPSEFRCKDGSCVDLSARCNDHRDCSDGSDEEDCGALVAPCPASDFTCLDGSCVPLARRCDGKSDCPNGADEQNCGVEPRPPACGPGKFRCDDGACIDDDYRCDEVTDCRDGSDEKYCDGPPAANVTCAPGDIVCGDGSCVDPRQRCDKYFDCPDGTDERDCELCSAAEFRCEDGQCIPEEKRCDTRTDCSDGSDELDCHSCRRDEFRCNDGMCLEASKECNGYAECRDGSDEADCGNGRCLSNQFRCNDGVCISGTFRCDGFTDCQDNSDEVGCSPRCSSNEFECSDQSCIPLSRKCDGSADCPDRSDEFDCPLPAPRTCGSFEFTCQDGSCIDSRRVCDRRPDCRDGSDEAECGCLSSEFQCGSGECISLLSRCNRRIDCRDGSDEEDCPTARPPPLITTRPPITCPPGQSPCRTAGQCIPSSAICDGRFDCQDFSDETNCAPTSPGGLNLKTYPEDQVIEENREVVFQCRDEGPLRARVRWLRGNGLPLPPGSRDINGRLEMPDIQVEHSGTYICEAIGVPPNIPRAQVSVHLTVEPSKPQPTRPPTACRLHEATCSNGECISKQAVCDGKFDCSDGSDELRCNPHGCEPNEFRCDNKKCVLKTWRCDSEDDCGDGSDESSCATNPPGSPCRYHEFQCRSGRQCIPRSFHCDLGVDCLDGSDEVGCSPVYIQTPPPPMVMANIGDVLTIKCTAIGVPIPEVVWRLNWGHIPSKCSVTSIGGVGTLTCPDIQESDQGAYSCEGINNRGSVIAVPDTIVVVKRQPSVCRAGYFNSEARSPAECISCFCFGVTTDCSSADLFTYQLPPPFDQYRLVGVNVDPSTGSVEIRSDLPYRSLPAIRPIERNGLHIQTTERLADNVYPYFAMPENYHGNQLKSYGGYLKYTVRHEGRGNPISAPDVILSGNGYILVHPGRPPVSGRNNDYSVRFFYGEWYKRGSARPGGDIPGEPTDTLATREEIMMTLGNVDNLLIRAQYDDGPILNTQIFNINMDSAGIRNTGQGKAVFVEECRCPAGYTGLSCEVCAPGYNRHQLGPWLGLCSKDREPCRPGTYGDPPRVPCEVCPCPLTNPGNQFGRTCFLDTDGQVTCDCPQGYVGRRCEQCAVGYQGNPFIPGDSCRQGYCNAAGSVSPVPDPATGRCICKDYTTGPTCNQCKPNNFHLDASNQFGCIQCFCSGVTGQCLSSNWYRQQVSVPTFTRGTQGFKLVEALRPKEAITDGLRVDPNTRELVFQDFSRNSPGVYYWLLPPQFLGDKVTSYGGYLNYTVRYVPTPGGQSSRNNAPDVELISSNDIQLLYFGRDQIEPNRPQSISVPILEQYWQRHDGQSTNREHLIMALADVEAILIKATYTTNTREAALIQVSLDIAEERNTGQVRALAVEQCQCPVGHRGLSCEDCDVGYTRSEGGLYLGTCEPCNCHGHSNECDPETGFCINCADHTTGDQCDICESGYSGDATQGTRSDCLPSGPLPQCRCDDRGSIRPDCPDGNQCICKTNVQGRNCDRCRPGTFSLSEKHIEGCLECFCSGVTDTCQQANLYRTQIPMQVVDSTHGFTLTDRNRNEVIDEGLNVNERSNEIGYEFPLGRSQSLFWSLPPAFTGNRITSYGGNLTVTQLYRNQPAGASPSSDTDVIIYGSGISVYWTNINEVISDRAVTFSIPLVENVWRRLDQVAGQKVASRADLLTVLSDVEAILVRASLSSQTRSTYISDVSLDTAVPQYTEQGLVTEVENCHCPPGYRGTSCELCSTGYYRDFNDRSASVLGACTKCPCNAKEESCSLSYDGRVTCKCLPGYTGRYCDSVDGGPTTTYPPTRPPPPQPTIIISVSEPTIQIVDVGSTVRYRCSGRSILEIPVTLQWSKEGGDLPRDRAFDDRQGLLVITDVHVSDSGIYICSASDGQSVVTQRVELAVGGSHQTAPQVTILPRYLEVREGSPVEFRCEATGNPAPTLQWTIGDSKQLNPEASFSNGVFRIPAVHKSDEAVYECIATNPAGSDTQRTVLYVTEGTSPGSNIKLTVEPPEYTGPGGGTVRLSCLVGEDRGLYIIRWSRANGRELPPDSVQSDGVLTIFNVSPADSDVYVCTATLRSTGAVAEIQARVTIVSNQAPPTVRIEPETQTISQGAIGELRCTATGDPAPTIRWSKLNEELGSNIQAIGPVLRIINALVRDRGVYICTAENAGGSSVTSAVIEVERREPPAVELYPEATQTVITGGSVLLQCRVTGGIPSPRVRWTRTDGRPLSSTIEELPGGVLRFNRVTQAEAGQYICHAESEAGSTTAVATLVVQSMPRITISPSTDVQVVVGQRVKLECRATGDPEPTVEWSKHRSGFAFYDTEPVTSAMPQTAVYEITRVTKADEGSYSCLARNAAGTTEERLHLTVEENEVIPGRGDIPGEHDGRSEPPHSGSNIYPTYPPGRNDSSVVLPDDEFIVPVNGRAEMRCIVKGNRDRIFLNWIRSDNSLMPQNHQIHEGVLYINNVQPSDAGEYSCLGIGPTGTVLFTATARLVVIAPPRIQLNPTRQVVRPGDDAFIHCTASGDQPINIQWSALGRDLPPSVSISQGLLRFHGIAVSDAGRYLCQARNSAGEAEAVAEVVVSENTRAPMVTAVQHDQSTYEGNSVQLRCVVPPGPGRPPYITWTRDRLPLPANAVVRGDVLQLTNVQLSDQGRYICEARSDSGYASDYINLRVDRVSNLAVRIDASQDVIRVGDTVDIRCSASGDTPVTFSWSKVGERLENNVQLAGNLLRVTEVRPANGGVYRCTARTSTGSYDEDYVLAIQDSVDVHHDAAAVETRTAPYGSTVVMDCRTDLEPPVDFVWSKQGGALPRDSSTRDAMLTIPDVRAVDAGTYVCTARNRNVKMDIPTVLVVTGVVPYFAQAPTSFMALPTLPDAYLQFNIEVSFKPESSDGLILYNGQQKEGGGDFVSLGLNNSYVEFRFDVGSGPAVIRSDHPIRIGEWHTVKLSRTRKQGTMYVDGNGPYSGTALGRFQGLDLVEPLYVGGVPDFRNIHRLSGFNRGFVGCISRLLIGSVHHELVRDATLNQGVTTCETCAVNPCLNQGVCQEATELQGYSCICPPGFSGLNCDRVGEACFPGACGVGRCINRDEGFECLCPFGKQGAHCENDIDISEPAFADDAYVSYPTPKALRRLKMALKFNPADAQDGLLMYCAQSEDGQGDFTSLAIRDKRLEFRFDTGSGPAVIRSEREVTPGEWTTVSVGRNFREGQIIVNDGAPVVGQSPGQTRGLNLKTPLYVGGYDKQRIRLADGVGVKKGFSGCVREIQMSGEKLDIVGSVVDAANVQDCGSLYRRNHYTTASPCDRNPCLNGGTCRLIDSIGHYNCTCQDGFSGQHCELEADLCVALYPCHNGGQCVGTPNSYKCRCPTGYGGTNCEQAAEFSSEVSFQGDGYIELSNSLLPHKTPTENEVITLEFSTTEPNGLIFWHGQTPDTDGRTQQDYVALAVVDGILEFSFELGSGPAQIQTRADTRVDDGKRHHVILRRQASDGSIELDSITEFGESQGILKMLNTRGNIYIGGLPDFDRMTGGKYLRGFVGCIHSLLIQESSGPGLNFREEALYSVNALPCTNDPDVADNSLGGLEDHIHK